MLKSTGMQRIALSKPVWMWIILRMQNAALQHAE
jgi:hypothetical protein